MLIPRRMTVEEYVAINGARGNTYTLLVRKTKERDHLDDPEIDGRTKLKDNLKR
jgi:hypothetical protein